MNAPRPNTRLDNLLQEFKRLAGQGLPMPRVTDIARVVGVPYNDIYRLLDLGQDRCIWTLERDGGSIIAIRGTQGDWKLDCSMRRNSVSAHSMRRYRDKTTEALSRKCLRCREVFLSAHIGNRLCVGCNAYAAQAAP